MKWILTLWLFMPDGSSGAVAYELSGPRATAAACHQLGRALLVDAARRWPMGVAVYGCADLPADGGPSS